MNAVPCVTCGTPTDYFSGRRCKNCWEVETRLEKYLQSPGGREWARDKMPLLDDWVDGHPDAWDYEAVLTENQVQVEWCDIVVNGEGNVRQTDFCAGWSLSSKNGVIHIGNTTETIARKAAALFVSLWQRGVSASFADKLMDGFITYLERQEGVTKGAMAKVELRSQNWRSNPSCGPNYLYLCLGSWAKENQILEELGLKKDDQVGIILSKLQRK